MRTPFRAAIRAPMLLAAFAAACNTDPNNPPPPNTASVTVAPDSLILFIGNTGQLTATQVGGGVGSTRPHFTWMSADPGVATVDSTGLVTGVAKGKTVVFASANTNNGPKQGQAFVQVADPSGSACTGVDTLQAWTGTMNVEWADSRTGPSQTITADDKANITFTVSNPARNKVITWTGDPTGTVDLNEKVTDNITGDVTTNLGSGPPVSLNPMTLIIDPDACTWRFEYSWGVNAVVGGLALNPEAVAITLSKELPLGVWQQGLSYTADFLAYPPNTPQTTPLSDQYQVESEYGIGMFLDRNPRGPAHVAITFTPASGP